MFITGVCVKAAMIIPGGIFSLHILDDRSVLCGGAKVSSRVI